MNLSGIISISGKPGLFKVVAQAKNSVIVESLEDKKRVPAYATDRISALEDISIYTLSEDKPLKEIYRAIYDKENGGVAPSHKEDLSKLKAYLGDILADYDEERVYPSDIKKLFQWYNLLHKSGNLILAETKEEEKTEKSAKKAKAAKEGDATEEKQKKKVAAKTTAAKATPKAPAAKGGPKSAGKATGAAKAKTTVQRKSGSN